MLRLLLLVLLSAGLHCHKTHLDYSKPGQESWKSEHSSCGGHRQSPINIISHRAVPEDLTAVEMVHYHNILEKPSIRNTGHSVSLTAEQSKAVPYIFGAGLHGLYNFRKLHFHWGARNTRGSEHLLNGIRFPMEMHVIHYNKKYENFHEALEHKDGLVVLAFFFQVGEHHNKKLEPVIRHLTDVDEVGTEVALNYTFPLSSLLPEDLDHFYKYEGSLTTPPCTEVVTWVVFPDAIPISFHQMHKFRKLASAGWPFKDTFRQVQPMGDRKVFVRKFINGRHVLVA